MSTASLRPLGPWLLGLSGLIPFIGCLALAFLAPPPFNTVAETAFISYGAVILSFLGGARWGAELVRGGDAPSVGRLAAAVVPSVLGWLAVTLLYAGAPIAIGLIIAGGVAQLFWDLAAARSGLLPAWTAPLRITLTTVAMGCCLILLVHVLTR